MAVVNLIIFVVVNNFIFVEKSLIQEWLNEQLQDQRYSKPKFCFVQLKTAQKPEKASIGSIVIRSMGTS